MTGARFGLRTAAMLVLAWVWIGLGAGAFLEVPTPQPGAFHLLLSSDVRGGAWIATALIAIATAWSRRGSPVGLAALFLMPGLYLASYSLSWVLYVLPGGSAGYPNGWYPAYLFLGLAAFVMIIAFIPARPARQARR